MLKLTAKLAFLAAFGASAPAYASNDLIFYEGNGCSQNPIFAYDSHRFANDNCQDRGECNGNNDEARSLRILRSVKNGSRIFLYDHPKAKATDDWVKITIFDNRFIPPEGYCLRSFERNFDNPRMNRGIQVEYVEYNGLDGKVSRVRVFPNPSDRI